MKILLLLALCAVVAAVPKPENNGLVVVDSPAEVSPGNRSFLVNALIRQLIAFVRGIIKNGSSILNIPPLDPLVLEQFHLVLPAGLINLDLQLKDIFVSGLGGFVVHKSDLQLSDLSFDIDIEVPHLDIGTEVYDLNGDILTAIPLFGNGRARFIVDKFRLKAKLFLKQSENEKSVIIDRIEGAAFDLPSLKSQIDGAIGGGDIDGIVNAIIEDVVVGYVNRFRGAIAKVASFIVDKFRLKAKLFLKQSENEKSVIIDRIEGAAFDLPSLKSQIDGAIGGGDIDGIVNAIIEDVVVGYVNRFRGAIAKVASQVIVSVGNPILEKLDTWRFIAPLLPK